ncbi:hypothetical protein G6F56_003505 [Rhizopus delemar]|nr:hypothetical protein G6F56_003505 [Rhizopus delemar]
MKFEVLWLILFICSVVAQEELNRLPLDPLDEPYQMPTTPKYDYAEVLHKSFLFYQAQKSGTLPYQRMAWKFDSCLDCIGSFGEDLSRAWYEATNRVKWGLPLAWTITQLAFNVMLFEDAMNSVDELAESLELLRWGADYLVSAHHNDTHIVGQWGLDVDLEDLTDYWVSNDLSHKATYITPDDPASEIVGEYSAALASVSIVWRSHDPEYADTLLDHAKRLYEFATENRESYDSSTQLAFQAASVWYPSSGYYDELAWSSAWLYAATQDESYLDLARQWYAIAKDSWSEYSWDEKGGGLHLLLYTLTNDRVFFENAMDYFNAFLPGPEQTAEFTPHGLAYVDHAGSIGHSSNVAFLMLGFAKLIGYDHPRSEALVTFAAQQINYALGDYGYSWVVGFGDRYLTQAYYDPDSGDERFILYGAVEGGPDAEDTWDDDSVIRATQDSNAAWTGAVAGLIDYYGAHQFEPFTDCGLDLGWAQTEMSPPAWPVTDCYHTCNEGCPRGELKSSFSWDLLISKEQFPQYLDTLYPGEGINRAAKVQSTTETTPPLMENLVEKIEPKETMSRIGPIIGISHSVKWVPNLLILSVVICFSYIFSLRK